MATESLGAVVRDGHTTFRVFSSVAERVELCLIDSDGPARTRVAERRLDMRRSATDPDVWELTDPSGPGQRYGYRVHGPWDRRSGVRCNPAKLLVDPYAAHIDEPDRLTAADSSAMCDTAPDGGPDQVDSLRVAPWSIVAAPVPPAPSTRPTVPTGARVIYEAHLEHLTRGLADIPAADRGTWRALRSPTLIAHLGRLGVTTLELLPTMHFYSEAHLRERGRRNVWGYNPLGLFAPHPAYSRVSPERRWEEIADTVRVLHERGIEVVLDVVFNHTAEGSSADPTLSLRGLDNATYYRTDPRNRARYVDVTGCGNTLNTAHPQVRRLVVDALRHWVRAADIDGFRFDLAVTLGREPTRFHPDATLLREIADDPMLADRLLIAEPWDVGPDGYQLGCFTAPGGGPWLEWNDVYRTAVRSFWRPHAGATTRRSDLARALAGSSEIFQVADRRATASVNYVTAHDGFTLHDLTAYNAKHNLANGEEGRDGTDDNRSWNGGVEGPTTDPAILRNRRRRQLSMLTTLLLAAGTPMLLAGDELARTQDGNNNPYCLDDPRLALNWSVAAENAPHADLVAELTAIRRANPALYSGDFLRRDPGAQAWARWYDAHGNELTEDGWTDDDPVLVAMLGAGDQAVLLALNGDSPSRSVRIPDHPGSRRWRAATRTLVALGTHSPEPAGGYITVEGFAAAVLTGK